MKLKGRALKALIEAIKIYEYKKHYPNKFGPLTVLWIKELEVEEEELPGENVASDEDAAYLLFLEKQEEFYQSMEIRYGLYVKDSKKYFENGSRWAEMQEDFARKKSDIRRALNHFHNATEESAQSSFESKTLGLEEESARRYRVKLAQKSPDASRRTRYLIKDYRLEAGEVVEAKLINKPKARSRRKVIGGKQHSPITA